MGDLSQYVGEFDPLNYAGDFEFATSEHPRIAALNIMIEYGMKPPQALPIGRICRFSVAQDKGCKKSGWCIYYENTIDNQIIGTITFGSFHGDPEKVIWTNKKTAYMSLAQHSWYTAKIEHARQMQDEERARIAIESASEAQKIWNKSAPVKNDHPYIFKKAIKPFIAKSHNEFILLPVLTNGEISSLQYIDAQGNKRFLPGGAIKGGYCILEGDKSVIYICEGWATGCSIHEATGACVYVCYQVSNIYDVTSFIKKENLSSIIKIAADNDRFKEGNPGLSKALIVGQSLECEVIVPEFKIQEWGTDFNDLHQQEGLDYLKEFFNKKQPEKLESTIQQIKEDHGYSIKPYAGVISDIVSYYNATSGNYQPGFALQTALALGSFFCGRYFMTDQKNVTPLYFLNIGKSGVGKEHTKTVIEEILYAAKLDQHIGGDGFTSDASVLGMLITQPRSIVCIDELGRYLKIASAQGMAMQSSAITVLMEAITRPTGILRAKNYSKFGLTAEQSENLKNRYVIYPSLTISSTTTPSTFYQSINIDSIKDGFLGRFIMYESKAPRELRKPTTMMDVPKAILDWCAQIKKRNGKNIISESHNQKPEPTIIPFTAEANNRQREFAIKILDLQNNLEESGLTEMVSRVVEFAMRLSLVCALSRDPFAKSVSFDDMDWACNYMDMASESMIRSVKSSMVGSAYDAARREIYEAIAKHEQGITKKDMQSRLPFMKHKTKDLNEMLFSLIEGELISQEAHNPPGRGRPTIIYKALPNE